MTLLRGAAAAWLACMLSACAASSDPAQGSQTHFLASCDASCPAPYDCICGVCTLPCTESAMCTAHAEQAECVAASAAASCEAQGNVCDVECSGDAECRALGAEHVCEAGRCREARASAAGEGGMSGGQGGESGVGTGGVSGGGIGGDAAGGAGAIAAPEPPLGELCDGTTDMRLLFGSTTGFTGPLPYEALTAPYGRNFFALDGQCRYYASLGPEDGVVTGTLTDAEAEQLAADIAWSTLDQLTADPEPAACTPVSSWSITAPGNNTFSCNCGCAPGSSPLAEERDAALEALYQLMYDAAGRGTAVNGAVVAVGHAYETAPGAEPEWPLDQPMVEIPTLVRKHPAIESGASYAYYDRPVVFEGSDADALRALRAADDLSSDGIRIRDAGVLYDLYVRDALPSDVERNIEALRNGHSGDPGAPEPLAGVGTICDGSAELRFGYVRENLEPYLEHEYPVTHPVGTWFFFIDGQCRFYASGSYTRGVFTGTLTERDVAWLAREVEWQALDELSEVPEEEMCPDNLRDTVFAPGLRVMCACQCDETPYWSRKQGAIGAAYRWLEIALDLGEPLTTPLVGFAEHSQGVITDQPAWPLERPLRAIEGFIYDKDLGGPIDPVRFDDEAELERLRALRAPWVSDPEVAEGDLLFRIVMRDELPEGVDEAIQALRDGATP